MEKSEKLSAVLIHLALIGQLTALMLEVPAVGARMLEVFRRNVEPTQPDSQFCDHGSHYRTAVFYHNDEQKRLAEASKTALQKNQPFERESSPSQRCASVLPGRGLSPGLLQENPMRYKIYHTGCGRDARLQALWGRRDD